MTELRAVWRLGFRPFFLLAGLFAIFAIILWIGIFSGHLPPIGGSDPILWHAHEMIYGYATAVIAGFVLTASQNWTGIPGIRGTKLMILVLLWLAGRICMSLPVHSPGPQVLTAVVDLSFYPALAVCMIPYLKPADMKVERVFFAYFALYFAGNLLIHLDRLGIAPGLGLRGALLGLYTTILMIIFMGGRVIPFFSESEKSKSQPRVRTWVEISAHASAWAFLVTQFFLPSSAISAAVAFLAAGIHFSRLIGWQVPRIRRIAILWVLHLAYFWIVFGFALFGLESLGLIALGPAVHAFAIGALGAMTYGMMTRVGLGHTGRKIIADRLVIAGYFLLGLAALVRVLGPILSQAHLISWVQISGGFWILAFVLFCWRYAPMLLAPRVDGRNG